MPAPYRVPGPCWITYEGNRIYTKDGCVIRTSSAWQPITDDQHGTVPADYIFLGKSCTVDVISINPSVLQGIFLVPLGQIGMAKIGELASNIGHVLEIIEQANRIGGGGGTWHAAKAIPIDPSELNLTSSQEMKCPLSFLIVPLDGDLDGKLFQTIPAYIR